MGNHTTLTPFYLLQPGDCLKLIFQAQYILHGINAFFAGHKLGGYYSTGGKPLPAMGLVLNGNGINSRMIPDGMGARCRVNTFAFNEKFLGVAVFLICPALFLR